LDFSIAEREVKEGEGVEEVSGAGDTPHPRCFAKRVWKSLKRKGGGWKKRAKSGEEPVSP
jgi:hypothetical protein